MNKKLAITIAASALAFGVHQAQAVSSPFNTLFQYRDADPANVTIAPAGVVPGNFNIATGDADANTFTVGAPFLPSQHVGETYTSNFGYPIGQTITDGEVDFWFHQTEGDTFAVNLLSVPIQQIITANGGSVSFKSDSLNVDVIAKLQATGQIDYQVINTGPGSIVFDQGILGVNVLRTPDGGSTAILLGLGALGLGVARRIRK